MLLAIIVLLYNDNNIFPIQQLMNHCRHSQKTSHMGPKGHVNFSYFMISVIFIQIICQFHLVFFIFSLIHFFVISFYNFCSFTFSLPILKMIIVMLNLLIMSFILSYFSVFLVYFFFPSFKSLYFLQYIYIYCFILLCFSCLNQQRSPNQKTSPSLFVHNGT